MRKITLASILLLTLLTACNETPTAKPTNTTPAIARTNALQQYKTFTAALDTLEVSTTMLAAQKFQELFKNETIGTRDSAFLIFEAYYEKLDNSLNELHAKDTTDYMPLVSFDDTDQPVQVSIKLKDHVTYLKSNGFKIAFDGEGGTYIQQDRDFIVKWFYDFVSPTLQQYLAQRNKENKEGFAIDGGIILEPRQFVNRVIWWEEFIKANPEFALIEQAKQIKKDYLYYLFTGMDNTPVRSYEDDSIEDYYITAYTYLETRFPASETNKMVNPYYKALQQKETAKAQLLLEEYQKKGYITSFE